MSTMTAGRVSQKTLKNLSNSVWVKPLPGASSVHVVVKESSGLMGILTTDAQQKGFSFDTDPSAFAVVHTFFLKTMHKKTFGERIARLKRRNRDELLCAYVEPLITEEHFPLKKTEECDSYAVHVVFLKEKASSDEVLSALWGSKMWMRPALFEELVDFGIAFPAVQNIRRITALGSVAKTSKKGGEGFDGEIVGSLSMGVSRNKRRRMIVTIPWETRHPVGEGFLAVRRWRWC